MRFVHLLVATLVLLCISAIAGAQDGQNTADLTQAVKDGVSAAAPSLFSGNWIAGIFGFLLAAVPAGLHVLQRQAQDKWNIFHTQQHIDNARAGAAPAVTVTDPTTTTKA